MYNDDFDSFGVSSGQTGVSTGDPFGEFDPKMSIRVRRILLVHTDGAGR